MYVCVQLNEVLPEDAAGSRSQSAPPLADAPSAGHRSDRRSQALSRATSWRRATLSKPLDREPKRDGTAERARTATRKAERERSHPAPPPVDLTVELELLIPTVACTNMPTIPTTERRSAFPVVAAKCTNCFMSALSSAHSRVGAVAFDNREAMNFFIRMHASEEDEAVV